ncbi:MAG: alcohol dehydrogenase [Candidatus Rokuibacteriota bacterium]|nr:MAG: alcohol dehydrogenase [Candidatus Rokubacteria bacterium]
MKAAAIERHGGPEVIEVRDYPDPRPAPGEVLVRVRACALNHRDVWVRRGMREQRLPHILGSDIAGEVASVPGGRDRLAVGTRVVLKPTLTCGRCEFCKAGQDNACVAIRLLGGAVDGGYAELIAVPRANVFPIPRNLSFVEAAAIPVVFLTAWHMLVTRADLRPGETVLVVGGASGVGSAAIQVALVRGARVLATAGSEAKRKRALELGAEHAIDHHADSISSEARRLSGGRGADVVVDHVGAATWGESLRSLARRGRFVVCGSTTGDDVTLPLRQFFGQNQTIHGAFIGTAGEFGALLRVFAAGRFRPVLDAVLPLAQAADAHRKLEQGDHFGKIVLATD